MKAVQIKQYGGNEVLDVVDIAKPGIKDGQILVEVHAASINPFDWKIRAGYLKEYIPLQFPVTLGGDIAGVISAVSDGVVGFKVGDHVFGSAIVLSGGSGAFAECAAANVGVTFVG